MNTISEGIVDPEAGLCYIHNNGNQGQRLFTSAPYASLRHNFWMMQNKAFQSQAGDETLKNKTIFLKHSNIARISFVYPFSTTFIVVFHFFSCFVPLKTSICFATANPRSSERHHQELCDELLKLRAVPSSAVASSSVGSPSLVRPSPQHFAQDQSDGSDGVGGKNAIIIKQVIYIKLVHI